jgi:hypothetical protein
LLAQQLFLFWHTYQNFTITTLDHLLPHYHLLSNQNHLCVSLGNTQTPLLMSVYLWVYRLLWDLGYFSVSWYFTQLVGLLGQGLLQGLCLHIG